jgi:hypothetical protein
MKKTTHAIARSGLLVAAAFAVAALWATSASAQCLDPRGDVTGNGKTDIVDIQCAIFTSLNGEENLTNPPACLAFPFLAADTNCDGNIDVTDLIILVQHAVGTLLDESIDADGNQCADECQVPGGLTGGFAQAGGVSTSSAFTLSGIGSGFESMGSSSSPSFVLRAKAMGLEPGIGE